MLRSFTLPEPPKVRSDGDLNTLEGWVVPYNQVADVVDITPTGVQRYQEGFLPRSCLHMEQMWRKRGDNAAFVRLTLDHESSTDARIGFGLEVHDRDEGCWAKFKLYQRTDLDLVRSMIEESHDSFSVEFDDIVAPVERDGVTWRKQVVIPAVTVTPAPAYAGAKVLALREADPADFRTEARDETDAWLEEAKKNRPTL